MPQGVILEEEGSEGWRKSYKVMARISLQADKQNKLKQVFKVRDFSPSRQREMSLKSF